MKNIKTIGIIGICENSLIFLDYCKKNRYETIVLNDVLASSFDEKCDKLIISDFFDRKIIDDFFSECDCVFISDKKINFFLFEKYYQKIISFDENIGYYQKNLLLQQEFFRNLNLNVLPFSSVEDKNSILMFSKIFGFPLILKNKLNIDLFDKNSFLIKNHDDIKKLNIVNFNNFFVQKEETSYLIISLVFVKRNHKIISCFFSKTTFFNNLMIKTEKYVDLKLEKKILQLVKNINIFLKNEVFYTISLRKWKNEWHVLNITCFVEKYSFWSLKNQFNCFEVLINSKLKNKNEQSDYLCYFIFGKFYYELFDFLIKNENIIFKDYLKDNFEETDIVGHFLVSKNNHIAIKEIKNFLKIKH
ncbi:hypothetical protein JTY60_01720 [symbiont of Argiope bruennichi]|uniref:hypothetical protein n=1 Tax=symbiont of Argiope bruennichi TaxID=2810479 RepID=UPI003DA56E92